MQNYLNARELLKKQLFDKLMCDRFGWEINIGDLNYILDIPLDKEEHETKIRLVEEIIRHLLFEFDTYLFHFDTNPKYQNIPTIFHLMNASIEFDDTPIDPSQVYIVDESTLQLKPDLRYDGIGDEYVTEN